MTHIYLLSAGQHQKVGRAVSVAKRLAHLRAGNPYPITLAAFWRVPASDAGRIEQDCFAAFRAFSEFDTSGRYRVSEWYKEEADILPFLIARLGPPARPEPRVWHHQFGPVELFLHLDGPFTDVAPFGRLAGMDAAMEQVQGGSTYPRTFFKPGARGDFWFNAYRTALDRELARRLANHPAWLG